MDYIIETKDTVRKVTLDLLIVLIEDCVRKNIPYAVYRLYHVHGSIED